MDILNGPRRKNKDDEHNYFFYKTINGNYKKKGNFPGKDNFSV